MTGVGCSVWMSQEIEEKLVAGLELVVGGRPLEGRLDGKLVVGGRPWE